MTERTGKRPRPLSPEDEVEARELLRSAPFAHIATAGDVPYVIPICFAYEEPAAAGPGEWGRLLFHTGQGRKTQAFAVDARVCLNLLAEVAFVPGDTPCGDAFSYRSVVLEGSAVLLDEETERTRALRHIVTKYDPEAADHDFDPAVFSTTMVYAVNVESLSLKRRPRRHTD